jgi:hypothetical protein
LQHTQEGQVGRDGRSFITPLLLLPTLRAAAVTVSVLAFAIITTGGLHWFTSPYVHQLLYNDKADTARVQTLKFFGGTRWHEFPVSAVEAPTGYHPLASFKVRGVRGQ